MFALIAADGFVKRRIDNILDSQPLTIGYDSDFLQGLGVDDGTETLLMILLLMLFLLGSCIQLLVFPLFLSLLYRFFLILMCSRQSTEESVQFVIVHNNLFLSVTEILPRTHP